MSQHFSFQAANQGLGKPREIAWERYLPSWYVKEKKSFPGTGSRRMFLTEGGPCLRHRTCSFLPPESSMVSFCSLKCPSLPNFLSVCVFSSLVLCPTTRGLCPLPRTDAPSLSPRRPDGLGILRALLKFKLMGAEFYVSCYFTCVPFPSCHWNLQVSGVLPDHLQIPSLSDNPSIVRLLNCPKTKTMPVTS